MIHTDPLSLLFIACFLFGLLYLLVTALLGSLGHGGHAHGVAGDGGHATAHHVHTGLHPHIHTGHAGAAHGSTHAGQGTAQDASQDNHFSLFAFVNPTSIVLFLLGFGYFGYLFHTVISVAVPLTLFLAVVGGVVIAGLLLAMLNRIFGKSEGTTVQDVSDRTGMLGKVSLTIPENGLGEVIYVSPGGMRKSTPARSVDGQRLERDQEVVVVNYQDGVAEVDTWEHFVNQEEAGLAGLPELPDEDELATLRALLEKPMQNDIEYVTRKERQKE